MSDGPVQSDFEDVMTGILNMQHVHELKSDDVSKSPESCVAWVPMSDS